jgi:hypothetical protein
VSAVRLISSRAFSSAARAWTNVPGIKPRIRSALAARANGCSGLGLVLELVLELDVEGDRERERFRELGVWGLERDGPDEGESGYQLGSVGEEGRFEEETEETDHLMGRIEEEGSGSR